MDEKYQKITPNSAEIFAKSLFKGIKNNVERKFVLLHSEGVAKTALRLSEGKKVDKNALIIGSWLHDIGRTESIKGHAGISLRMAEEKFGKLPLKIKDCIINHGNSGKPLTEEGKIIQLADKLSIAQDYRLFKLLFSKEKYKKKSLEMYGYVFRDLLEILKRYEF